MGNVVRFNVILWRNEKYVAEIYPYVTFRDQSNQIVKTLLAYGYNLEPPTSETGESAKTGSVSFSFTISVHE